MACFHLKGLQLSHKSTTIKKALCKLFNPLNPLNLGVFTTNNFSISSLTHNFPPVINTKNHDNNNLKKRGKSDMLLPVGASWAVKLSFSHNSPGL